MPEFPAIPQELIQYLFNLDQGRHVDAPCKKCRKVTDQVVVGYDQLPLLTGTELESILRRAFGMIPGMPILLGKPKECQACSCGTINR